MASHDSNSSRDAARRELSPPKLLDLALKPSPAFASGSAGAIAKDASPIAANDRAGPSHAGSYYSHRPAEVQIPDVVPSASSTAASAASPHSCDRVGSSYLSDQVLSSASRACMLFVVILS
jgi:hypothetical protein